MTITCNGTPLSLDEATLPRLLTAQLGDPAPTGVAIAVNDEVVPRDRWSSWQLAEGDRVEIVTAVQGG